MFPAAIPTDKATRDSFTSLLLVFKNLDTYAYFIIVYEHFAIIMFRYYHGNAAPVKYNIKLHVWR